MGLLAKEALGNAVQGSASQYRKFAVALKAGARIGPKQNFVAGGYNGGSDGIGYALLHHGL
jgi:hypothetical protein